MKNTSIATILVVEDDPATRRLMVQALLGLGNIIEAGDGEAALAAVREHPPEVICLDLGLPETTGFQVCAQVRRMPHAKATKILVVSGRNTLGDRALALDSGADEFLPKPFRARQLVQRVTKLLAAAQALQASGTRAAAVERKIPTNKPTRRNISPAPVVVLQTDTAQAQQFDTVTPGTAERMTTR